MSENDSPDNKSFTLAEIHKRLHDEDLKMGRSIVGEIIRQEVQALIDSGALPIPTNGFTIEWED